MERRQFVKSLLGAASVAPFVHAQSAPDWGCPVLDTHLHLRRDADACFTHMQGCGVTNAILLTPATDQDRAKQEMERRPGRFARSVRTDPTVPDAETVLRDALKGGAVSIGEMKFHVALDSPEMRRVYDIAAEMNVPVMMHIQTFPHFPGEMPYNTGYPQFDKVLRAYPRTMFIGHGDLFWAHISAEFRQIAAIQPGRSSVVVLRISGCPTSRTSTRTCRPIPGTTRCRATLLSRATSSCGTRRKLIFGSDCSCTDGKGSGVSQNNNPEAARLAGKCVARETLGLLKQFAAPDIFRRVVWENGTRLFKLRFS